MQNEYAAGDAVVVFDGPYWRAHAEIAHPQAPDGRAGVIVRDVTQTSVHYDPRANGGQGALIDGPIIGAPFQYEVEYADGTSAFVSVEHMALASQLAAAQAAAHAAAVAKAQAASDHAKQMTDDAAALKQAHGTQQKARSN
jgi:hypothetical protein